MEAFGISIKDANGEFRPMVDIVGQLSDKMKNMTAPERAKALQELFKGSGGTIQARRFFDLAIKNFDELDQRTKEMRNSAGVADEAYKIMFEQPQTQMQKFNNQWQIMKVTVGQALLPLRDAIVGFATDLLEAWNKLSPRQQELIVKFLAIAAALTVVVGIVTIVVGGILMLAGAAAMAGVALGTVGIIIAAVVAAIAVWVAEIVVLIKYHKQIEAFVTKVWEAVKEPILDIIHYFEQLAHQVLNILLPAFQQFWTQIKNGATAAWVYIQEGLDALRGTAEDLRTIYYALKLDVFFAGLARIIKTVFEVAVLSATYVIKMFIDIAGGVLGPLITLMGEWFGGLAKIIAGVVKLIAGILTGDWKKAWEGAKMIFNGFVQFVTAGLKAFVTIVFNILAAMATRLYDTFKMMWNRALGAIVSTTAQIISFVAGIPARVINAIIRLNGMLFNWAKGAFQQAKTGIVQKASEIISYVAGIPGRIRSALGNTGSLLYNAGRNVLSGFINGLKSRIGEIRNTLSSVTNMIPSWKGPRERDLKLLEPNAGWIMQGLIRGFQKELPGLRSALGDITGEVQAGVGGQPTGGGAPRMDVEDRAPAWARGVIQNFYITTQEIDPRLHAAELGYEVAKKVSK
jgi:phage-related protein